MPNRIVCLARPEDALPIPELRLIDPLTSATGNWNTPVPTSEDDALLLRDWLQQYLPRETWDAFVKTMCDKTNVKPVVNEETCQTCNAPLDVQGYCSDLACPDYGIQRLATPYVVEGRKTR